MKHQSSSIAVWRTLVVAAAVVALAGLAGSAQAAAAPNQITVHNQDLNSGVIVIDSVTAAHDGWIVVYKNPNLTAGEIVGYAPVFQGTNKDVKVTIDTAKVGDLPTLWAQLHEDGGVAGLFEWGLRNRPYDDPPVIQNGQPVVVGFGTAGDMEQAPSAPAAAPVMPAPAAPVATKAPVAAKPAASGSPIVVKNQDLNTGVIVLDSVTAPQDGWVVVYKDPNLTSGEIVGYAPVHQGANTNVKVTLNTDKIGDAPTLWAVLHADNDVKGIFEWGWKGQPYNDPPVAVNGHEIVAAFGTAADR